MTRVSLKEAYDNKDVVAQIYAIRDIAEGAEDTADSAVTTANTASDHVDALVPQVEGAVENANNASASAQASAQTVAGYENRLSAVEGETADLDSDLNAVTLRVTTAEGQIVTIQGRVTALETADGQNIKINAINNYAVGLTGNQTKAGILTLTSGIVLKAYQAETIEMSGGPRIGTNPGATQSIMRLFKNPEDTDYVTRDTLYQPANSKTVSRLWYLQRQNASGDGVETVILTLGFGADGRATLTIGDSQGTRVII